MYVYDYVAKCDACGELYCKDDIEECMCTNDHCFCINCSDIIENIIPIAIDIDKEFIDDYADKDFKQHIPELKKKILKMTLDNDTKTADRILREVDYYYNVPSEHCPICQSSFNKNSIYDRHSHVLDYVLDKYNINLNNIVDELNKRFKTYENLTDHLNGKNKKGAK